MVSEITGKAHLKWKVSAAACVHTLKIYTVGKYPPASDDLVFVFLYLKVKLQDQVFKI